MAVFKWAYVSRNYDSIFFDIRQPKKFYNLLLFFIIKKKLHRNTCFFNEKSYTNY